MRQRRWAHRVLHLSAYANCAFVADIFDDSRLALWQALGIYGIAEERDIDDLRKEAVDLLKSQDRKLDMLVDKALERIRDIPGFPEIEETIRKAVGEFRRQMETIRHRMETRHPYDEIEDQQMDEFERRQFDFQHKLFLLCLERYLEPAIGGIGNSPRWEGA